MAGDRAGGRNGTNRTAGSGRVCRGSSQFIVGGEILAGLSNGSVKLQSMQQLLLSLTTQCLASMAVIIIEYYQQRGQCMKQITLPRFQKMAKM